MGTIGAAGRIIRRSPGAATGVALVIGIGLGACLTIIGLLHDRLLADLPYSLPSRVVVLENTGKYYLEGALHEGVASPLLSLPDFDDVRTQARYLSDVGGAATLDGTLHGGERPRPVRRALVTERLLPLLAPRPTLGRLLNEADFRAGASGAALVTETTWHRRFSSDPAVVGRVIHLDDQPFAVVGVVPDRVLAFLQKPAGVFEERKDEWVISPLLADMAGSQRDLVRSYSAHRDWAALATVGRLAPGRALAAAETELKTIVGRVAAQHPATNRGRGLQMQLVEDWRTGEVRGTIQILLAAALLVFVVACLNAAGIVLADSCRRESERAVRLALGASASRLVAGELVRSLVMVLPGGLLAIVVAALSLTLVDRFTTGGTGAIVTVLLLPRVALAAVACTVVAGMVAGARSAWSIRRRAVIDVLKEGGATASFGPGRQAAMRSFVALQVACATALVLGAGLMLRSVWNIMAVDLGFEVKRNVTIEVRLPPSRYPLASDEQFFFRSALQRVRALPGVTAAGVSIAPPLTGVSAALASTGAVTFLTSQGTPLVLDTRSLEGQAVTAGYFEALGVKLLRGRWFSAADENDPSGAMIVDRFFCERYLGGVDPLTLRLRWNRRLIPIVGVVADVRPSGPLGNSRPMLYMLEGFEHRQASRHIVVRAADSSARGVGERVSRELIALDPEIGLGDPQTFSAMFAGTFAAQRRLLALLGSAGVVVLVLAAFSLVSSLAQYVAGRRRDIAVRLVLGAGGRDVWWLLARQVAFVVALGLAEGLLAGAAIGWTMSSELYGLSPTDGPTVVTSVGLLLTVAGLAAAVPAWRASRMDPVSALRSG